MNETSETVLGLSGQGCTVPVAGVSGIMRGFSAGRGRCQTGGHRETCAGFSKSVKMFGASRKDTIRIKQADKANSEALMVFLRELPSEHDRLILPLHSALRHNAG